MTLSELQSWLQERRYAEVRLAETATRALLPNGRRLRGLKISERLYLGRDMTFYHTILGMAEPLQLENVKARISLTVLDMRWQIASARARAVKTRRALRTSRQAS